MSAGQLNSIYLKIPWNSSILLNTIGAICIPTHGQNIDDIFVKSKLYIDSGITFGEILTFAERGSWWFGPAWAPEGVSWSGNGEGGIICTRDITPTP